MEWELVEPRAPASSAPRTASFDDSLGPAAEALGVELHAFCLHKVAQPFLYVKPSLASYAREDHSALPTVTSDVEKQALARRLGLQRRALKFAPAAAARAFLRWPPSCPVVVDGADPLLATFRRARGTWQRWPGCAGTGQELLAQCAVVELGPAPHANLEALARRLLPASPGGALRFPCPGCGLDRPVAGRRAPEQWRCSACAGDREHLGTLLVLGLQAAGGCPRAERALRTRLVHAVKSGQSEAAGLCCAALQPEAEDLDLALRARRPNVAAMVLARLPPEEVKRALAQAERDPRNHWGGNDGVFEFGRYRRELATCRAQLAGGDAQRAVESVQELLGWTECLNIPTVRRQPLGWA